MVTSSPICSCTPLEVWNPERISENAFLCQLQGKVNCFPTVSPMSWFMVLHHYDFCFDSDLQGCWCISNFIITVGLCRWYSLISPHQTLNHASESLSHVRWYLNKFSVLGNTHLCMGNGDISLGMRELRWNIFFFIASLYERILRYSLEIKLKANIMIDI